MRPVSWWRKLSSITKRATRSSGVHPAWDAQTCMTRLKSTSSTTRPISNSSTSAEPGERVGDVIDVIYRRTELAAMPAGPDDAGAAIRILQLIVRPNFVLMDACSTLLKETRHARHDAVFTDNAALR